MDVDPTLPIGPVLRLVSAWVASDAVPVPLAAFLTTRALHMEAHPPEYLSRMDGSWAPLVGAIDRRLFEHGVATWEEALALAHRYWTGDGWRDLAVWQARAFDLFDARFCGRNRTERMNSRTRTVTCISWSVGG